MGTADLEGISVEFLRNGDGDVCISFEDAEYVLSDKIVLYMPNRELHAILHENSHFIGKLSIEMADAIVHKEEILLAAPHYKGGIIDMKAPLLVRGAL